MSSSTKKEVFSLMDYTICMPNNHGNLTDQLSDCICQVKKLVTEDSILVKLVIFINACDNVHFYKFLDQITEFLKSSSLDHIPVTIVPQPPMDSNHLLSIESWTTTKLDSKVTYKRYHQLPYLVLKTDQFIQLIVSNINHRLEISDAFSQNMAVFTTMNDLLQLEGLNFSNVIRQWNFIENITGYTGNCQNYQIFNDIRTMFYSKDTFINGYPSATGIGMSAGGIIIDFIAVKPIENTSIWPIKSPIQLDPHIYSKQVLAPSDIIKNFNETSPKFERGKAILTDNEFKVYISGTAAIKGQESQFIDNAYLQTKLTIETIKCLIEKDNLLKNCSIEVSPNPIYFRVYIKRKEDIESVYNCFQEYMPGSNALFVIADICRPELLVEIEGIVSALV